MRTLVAGEGWKYNEQFTEETRAKRVLFVGPHPPEQEGIREKSYLMNYWSHSESPSEAYPDLETWGKEGELVEKVHICTPSRVEAWDVALEIFPSNAMLLYGLERVTQFLGVVICLHHLGMLTPKPTIEVHCCFNDGHVPDEIARKTIFAVYDTALADITHDLRIMNSTTLQEMAKELHDG